MIARQSADQLYAEAMKLPIKERLRLVMSLSETIDPSSSDPPDDDASDDDGLVPQALAAEVERRAGRFEAGTPGLSLDALMATVDASLRRP